ncbi:hypothetical protein [Flavobacterium koreense]
MGLFGLKFDSSDQTASKVILENNYDFMYENFIISSQRTLYLLLENKDGIIDALSFDFKIYKYGYPNDEVDLPSKISNIANYGMSEVFNSKWINELMINNRSHSQHSDSFYSNYKHYVIRFKDVTLEVISQKYEIVKMTKEEINKIITNEIYCIEK